jgi:hypothetical protein
VAAKPSEKPIRVSPLILPGMVVGGIGVVMMFTGFGVFGLLVAIAGGAMYLLGLTTGGPK